MKRFYLLKIERLFDEAFGDYVNRHRLQQDVYRGVEFLGGKIALDPATGLPTQKATLAIVGGIDHKRFLGDPGIVAMPMVAHDMKVSAIHTGTKLECKAAIKALGHDSQETEDVWGNADGMRDVLNHYGRLNDPDFDVNDFDLDES